jgi:hypothetical protein
MGRKYFENVENMKRIHTFNIVNFHKNIFFWYIGITYNTLKSQQTYT